MPYQDIYSDTYELDQRHKSFPTLETVVWNIDGTEVQVDNDWSATATDRGGFDEALIRVLDSDRLPRGVMRGMTLTAYEKGSGETVWEGTVDGEPQHRGMSLEVRGVGHKRLLTGLVSPENYMTQDIGLVTDAHDAPHSYANNNTELFDAQVMETGLKFVREVEDYTANDARFLILWTPGSPITYFDSSNLLKSLNPTNFEIRLQRATGPSGSRTTVGDFDLSSGGPSEIDTGIISGAEDCLLIGIRCNTTTPSTKPARFRLLGCKFYGIAAGDFDYRNWQVVMDLATRAGLTTSRVLADHSIPILPFYSRGSHADAIDYMCELADTAWGIYKRSDGVEYGPYETEWTCAAESGATVLHCDPLRPFSSVLVKYPTLGGDESTYELAASPDPNEDEDEHPQAEFELLDAQAGNAQAGWLALMNLEYLSGPRWDLEVHVTHARENGVPVSPYRIRPGGLLTVRDCHPHGSATDRIRSVRYTTLGTEVFCNSNASIAEEIVERAESHGIQGRRKRPRHRRRHRRPRL